MLRKHLSILIIVMMVFLAMPLSFAGEITESDFVVAEPVKGKITNEEKAQSLIVNIINLKIAQEPLYYSVVRIEDQLPFAKEIESVPGVSIMNLTFKSTEVEGITPTRTYSIEPEKMSVNFVDEIKQISKFFELKKELSSIEANLKQLSEGFDFTNFLNPAEAKEKLSAAAYKKYEKWLEIRKVRSTLIRNLLDVQNKYLKMFETPIASGKVETSSKSLQFKKDLGVLRNGNYRLRFFDADDRLISEMSFEMVEKGAAPVLPTNKK